MGITFAATDQPVEPGDTAAWLGDVIKNLLAALVTTVDATGIMRTRQLPNVNTSFSGNLWFFSNFDAPFLNELRTHPDVLVTYTDPGSRRFVVLNGVARLIRDPARARELWQPTLAPWFAAGPDDPELALIEVNVESVDLWE